MKWNHACTRRGFLALFPSDHTSLRHSNIRHASTSTIWCSRQRYSAVYTQTLTHIHEKKYTTGQRKVISYLAYITVWQWPTEHCYSWHKNESLSFITMRRLPLSVLLYKRFPALPIENLSCRSEIDNLATRNSSPVQKPGKRNLRAFLRWCTRRQWILFATRGAGTCGANRPPDTFDSVSGVTITRNIVHLRTLFTIKVFTEHETEQIVIGTDCFIF